jgi:hypothetical protein
MSTTDFKHLTPKDIEWLEKTYDDINKYKIPPAPREVMGYYWIGHVGWRFEHAEVGTLREVEDEIERVVLEKRRRS